MSIKKYKLLSRNIISMDGPLEAGTIVYQCQKHDYSLARDDSNHTGEEHISLSLKPDGDYPFFTYPLSQLLEIKE